MHRIPNPYTIFKGTFTSQYHGSRKYFIFTPRSNCLSSQKGFGQVIPAESPLGSSINQSLWSPKNSQEVDFEVQISNYFQAHNNLEKLLGISQCKSKWALLFPSTTKFQRILPLLYFVFFLPEIPTHITYTLLQLF